METLFIHSIVFSVKYGFPILYKCSNNKPCYIYIFMVAVVIYLLHWYLPPVLVFVANTNSWTLDPASLCAATRTLYHVAGIRSGITSSSCWMLLETSVHVFWPRERYSAMKYWSGQPPLGHASRNKVTDVELISRISSCVGSRGAVDNGIIEVAFTYKDLLDKRYALMVHYWKKFITSVIWNL